ncbi:hypothetical protein LWI28_011752 [Acer negundo]|uniref:NET domain-containing protein n=1 Tax=Acer negundo TaxID=4023 RepID=A0AAD5J4T4_ACENE|nr:hypothetical protein LWI28_011752 [Acer negundo]KAK4852405.1 hypothetical protein QYF36_023728 [Acer negundo]
MEAKSEPLMQVPEAVSNSKPKAKDPNKREMSTEERQKLGTGLQSLPPEKIGHVVDILTKRNRNLRDKDEFEVNVEDLDTETLWKLDRFVTNYKMSHRVSETDVVPAAASNPNPNPNPPISAKPKAKDPNKRAMSMEEKHKLEIGLQS